MDVWKLRRSPDAHGASLVGILMVIVVLGALTATAMVSVTTLTGSGNGSGALGGGNPAAAVAAAHSVAAPAVPGGPGISARTSCTASADAARSASTFFFANSGGRSYPVKWSDMTTASPPMYKPPTNVVINRANPKELDGRGWQLILSGGGATASTFTCR